MHVLEHVIKSWIIPGVVIQVFEETLSGNIVLITESLKLRGQKRVVREQFNDVGKRRGRCDHKIS